MSVELRIASKPADVEFILAAQEETMALSYTIETIGLFKKQISDRLAKALCSENIVIATDGEERIGYYWVETRNSTSRLLDFYLIGSKRGSFHADALFQSMKENLVAKGVRELLMTISTKNLRSNRFFRRQGAKDLENPNEFGLQEFYLRFEANG